MRESIPKPRRWDQPFADTSADMEMNDAWVQRLMNQPPFAEMDASEFPKTLPLAQILRNDSAVRRYGPNDLIVRSGDYGHSAFIILEGRVGVVQPRNGGGGDNPEPKTIKRGLFQRRSRWPEVRDPRRYTNITAAEDSPELQLDRTTGGRDSVLIHMETGQMFGELAALGRGQRTATVFAVVESMLLELRWQGLRELTRFNQPFAERVYSQYRKFGLQEYLATYPPFGDAKAASSVWINLDQGQRDGIIEQTSFESVGGFDWFREFGSESRSDPHSLIVTEGDYVNNLILIRAGFAKISHHIGSDQATMGVLRRGDIFGLQEVAHNYRHPNDVIPFRQSLYALGYTDVLKVPIRLVEQYVLDRYADDGDLDRWIRLHDTQSDGRETEVQPDQLEFLIENRIVNGTRTMLIDTNRCVGCDDCVRACANVHDNNPRFIREGPKMGNYMVAHACMHCTDAVCVIDCPTGAIHRDQVSGMVVINDDTCIGCGNCAIGCPYDNIQLVTVRDRKGRLIRDDNHVPIQKATKCDFCFSTPDVAPACERACPHDALKRIDMGDLNQLAKWLNR